VNRNDDFDSDGLRVEARAALRELVVDLRDLEEALRQFANQAAFVDAFARRREDAGPPNSSVSLSGR
jgi:hypothetical protein